jgi:hypothetical protein
MHLLAGTVHFALLNAPYVDLAPYNGTPITAFTTR